MLFNINKFRYKITSFIKSKKLFVSKRSLIKQLENISKRVDSLQTQNNWLRQKNKPFIPVHSELNFATFCYNNAENLNADVYIAHGVQGALAAQILKEYHGGKSFCDVIETPSFFDLINQLPWSVPATHFLNYAHDSLLNHMDGLLTIGPTLAASLSNFDIPVTVIPNYRYEEELFYSNILRKKLGIPHDNEIILIISTITSGLEMVLKALSLLPDNIHLVIMGSIFPQKYADSSSELITNMDLSERVHIIDQVPYEELTENASSANIGIIVRDPSILNNYVSLPNRIFDYIFSSLPVCVPAIPDIAELVEEYQIGTVVEELTPKGWSEAIKATLLEKKMMRENALKASKKLTWKSIEEKLYKSIGSPRKVVFVGTKDLKKNNRTQRMALTLANKGVEVIICTRQNIKHENILKSSHEKISYKIYTPEFV